MLRQLLPSIRATIVLAVLNATSMTMRERRSEIAVLRSLGFIDRDILAGAAVEVAFIALIGGVVGIGIAKSGMARDVIDPLAADVDDASVAQRLQMLLARSQHRRPHALDQLGDIRLLVVNGDDNRDLERGAIGQHVSV